MREGLSDPFSSAEVLGDAEQTAIQVALLRAQFKQDRSNQTARDELSALGLTSLHNDIGYLITQINTVENWRADHPQRQEMLSELYEYLIVGNERFEQIKETARDEARQAAATAPHVEAIQPDAIAAEALPPPAPWVEQEAPAPIQPPRISLQRDILDQPPAQTEPDIHRTLRRGGEPRGLTRIKKLVSRSFSAGARAANAALTATQPHIRAATTQTTTSVIQTAADLSTFLKIAIDAKPTDLPRLKEGLTNFKKRVNGGDPRAIALALAGATVAGAALGQAVVTTATAIHASASIEQEKARQLTLQELMDQFRVLPVSQHFEHFNITPDQANHTTSELGQILPREIMDSGRFDPSTFAPDKVDAFVKNFREGLGLAAAHHHEKGIHNFFKPDHADTYAFAITYAAARNPKFIPELRYLFSQIDVEKPNPAIALPFYQLSSLLSYLNTHTNLAVASDPNDPTNIELAPDLADKISKNLINIPVPSTAHLDPKHALHIHPDVATAVLAGTILFDGTYDPTNKEQRKVISAATGILDVFNHQWAVLTKESGFDRFAASQSSTARGMHEFMETPWLEALYSFAHDPDAQELLPHLKRAKEIADRVGRTTNKEGNYEYAPVHGLTKAQIQEVYDARYDLAVSHPVWNLIEKQNQEVLAQIPINDWYKQFGAGNLKSVGGEILHNFGQHGGTVFLTSDPNLPADQIMVKNHKTGKMEPLFAAAIKSNPGLMRDSTRHGKHVIYGRVRTLGEIYREEYRQIAAPRAAIKHEVVAAAGSAPLNADMSVKLAAQHRILETEKQQAATAAPKPTEEVKAAADSPLTQVVSAITGFFSSPPQSVMLTPPVVTPSTAAKAETPAAPTTADGDTPSGASSYMMIDDNGCVLAQDHAEDLRWPASMTKMMTVYLAFQQIEAGKLKFTDYLEVPAEAVAQKGSKAGLKAGQRVSVKQLIELALVPSANDAAYTLGLGVFGNLQTLQEAMNHVGKSLGMKRTNFNGPTGRVSEDNTSDAADFAVLQQDLVHQYPQWDSYFGIKKIEFQGHTYANHNALLGKFSGMIGKTGWILHGYNLTASAEQNGHRLYVSVYGGEGDGHEKFATQRARRDRITTALLVSGFQQESTGHPICVAHINLPSADTIYVPNITPHVFHSLPALPVARSHNTQAARHTGREATHRPAQQPPAAQHSQAGEHQAGHQQPVRVTVRHKPTAAKAARR